jgi:hypothetical protein
MDAGLEFRSLAVRVSAGELALMARAVSTQGRRVYEIIRTRVPVQGKNLR